MNTGIILDYLTGLAGNNNREWYHAHKKKYQEANEGFIPASNEPSIHACMDIWRLPRGVLCASGTCFAPTEAERRPNIPLLCSIVSLIPYCLQRGL